jgi:hypothetical protein
VLADERQRRWQVGVAIPEAFGVVEEGDREAFDRARLRVLDALQELR